MKKTMMMMAVAVMALTAACTGKKTAENAAVQDTTSVVDSAATPSLDLAVVAGTYEGTLPAADCRASRLCSPSTPTEPTS